MQNLRSIGASSDTITVAWDEVSCAERNGNITGYWIKYGITKFDNGETQEERFFTAYRLRPLTTYMFKVAASNSFRSTGPFSAVLSRKTLVSSGKPQDSVLTLPHKICRCYFVALWAACLQPELCEP